MCTITSIESYSVSTLDPAGGDVEIEAPPPPPPPAAPPVPAARLSPLSCAPSPIADVDSRTRELGREGRGGGRGRGGRTDLKI